MHILTNTPDISANRSRTPRPGPQEVGDLLLGVGRGDLGHVERPLHRLDVLDGVDRATDPPVQTCGSTESAFQ